ncbi:hypothetical protein EV401DRAFT_1991020 [Pisolithus croceorrhizus]|nr:hypothetical protein EV401DRAFT_1991020 [Pisolithus croceorrhizus]
MQAVHSQVFRNSGLVNDVLSGKERIFPFANNIWSPVGRDTTTCALFALNFVRMAFQQEKRAKGHIDTFFESITEPAFAENLVSICDQCTGDAQVDVMELCHLPIFKDSFKLDRTKYGPPSVMQLKLALRELQSCRSAMAMIVSRTASVTLCMKIPVWGTNIFLVLDLRQDRNATSELSLVVNRSLDETAGRMSGILPIDNRLLSRDMQWQAQLTASCAIHTFSPITCVNEGRSTVADSMALLRSWVEAANSSHQAGQSLAQRPTTQQESRGPSAPNRGRTEGNQPEAGPSRLLSGPQSFLTRATSFIPYEQTKRYARIFFLDNLSDTSLMEDPESDLESDEEEEEEEEEEFDCGVCFEPVPVSLGVYLDPCRHAVCGSCITGHVCAKISERRFPVFCPLCMVDPENINPSPVPDTIVQRLELTDEEHKIWVELEMAQFAVQIQCHRCGRSAFADKDDHNSVDQITCPFSDCNHIWCKNCQRTILSDGPKHSCDGSSEFKHLVKQMGWKHCPNCKAAVQKMGGCNHMTCATPGCNSHFCYKCGKQIAKSPIQMAVSSAVTAHYRQCTM